MSRGRLAGALFLMLAACRGGATGPATTARIELAGGSNPGTYEVLSATPACSRDLVAPGSWDVQLTSWTGPKAGLRSLQLVIPDRGTPAQFYLGMVFGDFFTGVVHEIEARPAAPRPRGHGAVTVQEREGTATVRLTGVTQDSVSITATIACVIPQAEPGATQ